MSAFGNPSGFGSPPPPQNSFGGGGGGGFGMQQPPPQQQQPQQSFGTFNTPAPAPGFGSTPAFGSAATSSGGGFGGGGGGGPSASFGANNNATAGGGFRGSSNAQFGTIAPPPTISNTATSTPGGFGSAAPFNSGGGGAGFGGDGGGGFGTSSNLAPSSSSAAPSGFGAAPTPSTSGFGGGSGFGASATTTATTGFGAPAAPAPAFGAASPPPQQQAAPATGFGASPNVAGAPFGSTAPANNTQTGFGGGGGSGFGTASSAAAPFGSPPASAAAPQSTTFGSAATPSSQPQQQQSASSPFGGSAPAATSSISFGTSSNVATPAAATATTTTTSSGGFGTSSNGGGGGFGTSGTTGGGFGTASSTFGGGNNTSSGFGGGDNNNSSGFGGGGGGGGNNSNTGFGTAPSSTFGGGAADNTTSGSVFSASTVSSSATTGFGASASTAFGSAAASGNNDDMAMSGGTAATASTTQKDATGMDTEFQSTSKPSAASSSPLRTKRGRRGGTLSPTPEEKEDNEGEGKKGNNEDELARLKTKLEEKKKRLMEKKQAKAKAKANATTSGGDSAGGSSGGLNAFGSSSGGGDNSGFGGGGGGNSGFSGGGGGGNRGFGAVSKSSTSSLLPPELQIRAKEVEAELAAKRAAIAAGEEDYDEVPASSTDNDDDDDDDENATPDQSKSLVGTCEHMCPDEELIQRDMEGDIQLLETPDPGGLHPKHFNLRDTAVKRFRRSAADFKLDIPELVRPPVVLERVCGYLEESVMERDRQGPDPRYNNQPPPPLDVYQFIWDRTRMVRKDFILQNYTGTGGRCNAIAVRCHERIARWHAMCEHQLSHIQDFVTQQSQQNIQELGQTMKTLNQYYDDAQGRSVMEVTDGDMQTPQKSSPSAKSHGCTSDVVLGAQPADYNGSPMKNSDKDVGVMKRFVGSKNVNSVSCGTAEPEMRGLYILLTMNNDGGMEVLKYAGKLCEQRPEIFRSKPVQLALSIFQAKKEYNYARFFSIMRSPSTPYLFACIMFKYVEQMRKVAFRIMSKTFGARRKDTGEAMYDSYPLADLVELLCFEDLGEAREACRHYNITAKEAQSSSGSRAEVVFWRKSDFREPKDPSKGTTLALKPRKMMRTIEAKLNGATRLAVCRGEASGKGAVLSKPLASPKKNLSPSLAFGGKTTASAAATPNDDIQKKKLEMEAAQAAAAAARAELEKQRQLQIAEEKRQKEEMRRRQEEQARQEAERRRLEDIARKEAEAAKQRELLLKKQREQELVRQKAEMERKKAEEKRKAEKARAEAAVAAAEELKRRKKEEEMRRIALEKERQRKLAEEREKERRRKEEEERQRVLELQRQEKERQMRLQREAEEKKRREEEEKRRREAEAERQRLLKLQREREEEEERQRIAREEEKRRIALEWKRKMDSARRILVWRKWHDSFMKKHQRSSCAKRSLANIDPTYSSPMSPSKVWLSNKMYNDWNTDGAISVVDNDDSIRRLPQQVKPNVEELLYRLGTEMNRHIDITKIISEKLLSKHTKIAPNVQGSSLSKETVGKGPNRSVVFCKMAIVLPETDNMEANSMVDLILLWMNSRFCFGHVATDQNGDGSHLYEVRTVVVNGNADGLAIKNCDAVLFIIPPLNALLEYDAGTSWNFSAPLLASLSTDIPRVVFVLDDNAASVCSAQVYMLIESVIEDSKNRTCGNRAIADVVRCGVASGTPTSLDASLQQCSETLLTNFVDQRLCENGNLKPPSIEQVSVLKLGVKCIIDSLWQSEGAKSKFARIKSDQPEEHILANCRKTLEFLIAELCAIGDDYKKGTISSWPATEFSSSSGNVDGYFSSEAGLPHDWRAMLERERIEKEVWSVFHYIKNSTSMHDILEDSSSHVPYHVYKRMEDMLMKKQFRRCLESFLQWHARSIGDSSVSVNHSFVENQFIYMSTSDVAKVFENVLKKQFPDNTENEPSSEGLENRQVASRNSFLDFLEKNQMVALKDKSPPRQSSFADATATNSPPGPSSASKRSASSQTREMQVRKRNRAQKRARLEAKARVKSANLRESMDFTSKLEALLHGEATIDTKVGNERLSNILGHLGDRVQVPKAS